MQQKCMQLFRVFYTGSAMNLAIYSVFKMTVGFFLGEGGEFFKKIIINALSAMGGGGGGITLYPRLKREKSFAYPFTSVIVGPSNAKGSSGETSQLTT